MTKNLDEKTEFTREEYKINIQKLIDKIDETESLKRILTLSKYIYIKTN